MADFDDWLAAYDRVYRALPAASRVPCPRCWHRTLRLIFTGSPGADFGYASFWCDTCLEGVHLSRVPIPEGVTARVLGASRDGEDIPHYRVIG